MKPHKVAGPDNIPTRLLKDYACELAPCLTLIFQASLTQGKIPADWKFGHVAPIFKKGDRHKASNYRPITLTSVTCKLLEHILHSSIISHLETHHILSDAQYGFRKKRSCETQLIRTIHDLATGLNEKQQIDAILLDFSKAFDVVPHKRLLLKLSHYGIGGNTLAWIQDFLSNRTQRVLLEGQVSSQSSVTSGVPQGSVLGPLLFLVFINDLPECVSSTTRLFADDSLLYRVINSPDDARLLQEDLNNLQMWEKLWGMSFNPDKCEVLRITNKRSPIQSNYVLHGHTLALTSNAKYLGVTISSDLSWNVHINNITKKANRTLGFLRRNVSKCPKEVKTKCYETFVRPILEYSSSAWAPHTLRDIQSIEAVQRRAARFVTGDYGRTSSVSSMMNTLQWDSLHQRRTRAQVLMFYKVVTSIVDIPVADYLTIRSSRNIDSLRGHTQKYIQPRARILAFQYSFFPYTIKLWNSLDPSLIAAPSAEAFRHGLTSIQLP